MNLFKCIVVALSMSVLGLSVDAKTRVISVDEYRAKMAAGWIGQMAGVTQGAPTEFRWGDKIIPEESVPKWTPTMINDAFGQDDLYVEMTFLRTMEVYGLDCDIRQAGIDFANSGYPLWCANNEGRNNLRRGIAPPDSSHPKFNKCPNDIDYQIEADYSGLIAPGLPQVAIDLGSKFGRLMNYSDGVYAGQFIGALYAEAFFESDPIQLVQKALKAIPEKSQYAEMVRDLLQWHQENPTDWVATWNKCQEKYRKNPEYQKCSNGGIDCKINGAYVLLGLLYGNKDMDATIVISMRGGQDSDCNPSSSAGVLGTIMGMKEIPTQYTEALNKTTKFSHTEYCFPELLNVCEKLARQVVVQYGGKIVKTMEGTELFVIPDVPPVPSKLVYSWNPEPIAQTRFTDDEATKILYLAPEKQLAKTVDDLFSGWKLKNCGPDMEPGLREEFKGQKNVLCVHPLDRQTGCTLSKTVLLPENKNSILHLLVANDSRGDFALIVKVNGTEIYNQAVSDKTTVNGWYDLNINLGNFAGKEVTLELIDFPNDWAWEAAYWKEISIK